MARLPSHFQMLLQKKEGVQAAELVYLSKVPRHHKHYCGTKTLIMVPSPGSDGCLVIPSTYEVDGSCRGSGRTEAAKDKERRVGRSNHHKIQMGVIFHSSFHEQHFLRQRIQHEMPNAFLRLSANNKRTDR